MIERAKIAEELNYWRRKYAAARVKQKAAGAGEFAVREARHDRAVAFGAVLALSAVLGTWLPKEFSAARPVKAGQV